MQKLSNQIPRVLGALLLAIVVSINSISAFEAVALRTELETEQYAYIPNESIYFMDIGDKYDWAYREIDYLASLGIVDGTGNYLFDPEAKISRGDFMLMLYRAYNMSSYTTGKSFADVPIGIYYGDAISAAKELGIATGSNGNFSPKSLITREDAMVLLLRTMELAGAKFPVASLEGFTDVALISDYASDAVGALVGAGVISGDSGKILPKAPISRVELAVMLYRALMVEFDESGGANYVAHPERINLCIGEKIYSNAIVENYNGTKYYGGLMELQSFSQTENGYTVRLGTQQSIDKRIEWNGTTLKVNGVEKVLAADCVPVQVYPYGKLEDFATTGMVYQGGQPSFNEKGEVQVVYYRLSR